MTIDSQFEQGASFLDGLSQEERNFFVAFRYSAWDGKVLKPGQRYPVIYDEERGLQVFQDRYPRDIKDMFARAYGIIKREFEADGRKVKSVAFVQEKAPKETSLFKRMDIAHVGAAKWHNHDEGRPGEQAIIVLSDDTFTEFAVGEIGENSGDFHENVEQALAEGKAQKVSLPAGTVGHMNKETVHRRGAFKDQEARVVAVVSFES